MFFGIASGLLSLADVVIKPMNAFGTALADLTTAIFGGPAEIILAGVEATAQSILGPFNLGPFSFALAIGAVLAGLYLVGRYRGEDETGNFLIGLPFDIPFIGQEEEGDG